MIFFYSRARYLFKAGGPRLGLTMSQGDTRRKSLGTTDVDRSDGLGGSTPPPPPFLILWRLPEPLNTPMQSIMNCILLYYYYFIITIWVKCWSVSEAQSIIKSVYTCVTHQLIALPGLSAERQSIKRLYQAIYSNEGLFIPCHTHYFHVLIALCCHRRSTLLFLTWRLHCEGPCNML